MWHVRWTLTEIFSCFCLKWKKPKSTHRFFCWWFINVAMSQLHITSGPMRTFSVSLIPDSRLSLSDIFSLVVCPSILSGRVFPDHIDCPYWRRSPFWHLCFWEEKWRVSDLSLFQTLMWKQSLETKLLLSLMSAIWNVCLPPFCDFYHPLWPSRCNNIWAQFFFHRRQLFCPTWASPIHSPNQRQQLTRSYVV